MQEETESVLGRVAIKRRVQISQWTQLIVYANGSIVIRQGGARVELCAYDAARLCNALLAEMVPPEPQDDDALYAAAKRDEHGGRAFVSSDVDEEEYEEHLGNIYSRKEY